MQTIQDEVRTFIIDNFLFGQRSSDLTDDSSFLESGVIDSTGVLELIGFIEQRYKVTIADDELVPANLDSVSRVTNFIQRKLQSADGQSSSLQVQA
jgi:acyl carrier protein